MNKTIVQEGKFRAPEHSSVVLGSHLLTFYWPKQVTRPSSEARKGLDGFKAQGLDGWKPLREAIHITNLSQPALQPPLVTIPPTCKIYSSPVNASKNFLQA